MDDGAASAEVRPHGRGGVMGASWRVLLAVVAVVAAVATKIIFSPVIAEEAPFLLLSVPVVYAAWQGGTRAALVAIGLGVLAAWYFFLPPLRSFAVTPASAARALLFLGEGLAIAGLSVSLQRAMRRAEASERRLSTTLRSIADGVIATDGDGRVTFMNRVAERLTGWTGAQAAGRPIAEVFPLVHGGTRTAIESPAAHVLRERKTATIPDDALLVSRTGEEYAIEDSAAPVSTRGGEGEGVVIVFRDVSEKRREEERRNFIADASQTLLGSLEFEQTLARVARLAVPRLASWCSIYLVDDAGIPISIAVAHVDPAKVSRMEQIQERFPPRPERDSILFEVLRTQRARLLPDIPEHVLAGSAQSPEHLAMLQELGLRSAMLVPLVARGRTLGAIIFAMSEPKRRFAPPDLVMAEDLARRAAVVIDNARLYADAQDAVRARDEFLSIASHELKTPLTPLQLQLDNLERSFGKAEMDRARLIARLEQANRQTRRLTRLVETLLDVSKVSLGNLSLEVESFDLVEAAREVVERHREDAEREGSTIVIESSGTVVGRWDRIRIEQVVANLLSNAIKYGPGHPITVRIEASEETVRLSVSDEGIGIATRDAVRIFGRFERAVSVRNYGGLGLGLYMARQIAEAHGGSILVQSQPGIGSTFTVVLPREPAFVPPEKRPSSPESRGLA